MKEMKCCLIVAVAFIECALWELHQVSVCVLSLSSAENSMSVSLQPLISIGINLRIVSSLLSISLEKYLLYVNVMLFIHSFHSENCVF